MTFTTRSTCRLCSGPPLPEQPRLDAVIAHLRQLAPAEIMALSVKSGIHLPTGELAPGYRKAPK